MSKIKVDTIRHTGGSADNVTLDASQNVTVEGNLTVDGTTTLTGAVTGDNDSVSAKYYLINGVFQIAQRGSPITATGGGSNQNPTTNTNDKYVLDRWILLSDGSDIVDVSRATEAPANQYRSAGLDVETANKKFGLLQVIEHANCVGLIGGTATLSFKMKASAVDKLDSVKAAVVSWSSTADAVTSDIISAWGAEGTRPTLIANWTYENANDSGTTGNFTPTTSWATYTLKNVSIDTSSTTNVGVFIWSDVTDTTAGQFLYITDVQLETGATNNAFERRSYHSQFAECQRYYQYQAAAAYGTYAAGTVSSSTQAYCHATLMTPMRVDGSSIAFAVSAASDFYVLHGSSTTNCTAIDDNDRHGTGLVELRATVSSGLTTHRGATIRDDGNGYSWMEFDAEL